MDIIKQFKETTQLFQQGEEKLDSIRSEIDRLKQQYQKNLKNISDRLHLSTIDEKHFKGFFDEPYVLLPTGKKEEWYVVVPKFIRMNIGWLDFTTDTYNIFRINKFIDWLGEIPEAVREKFKFKPKLPLKVYDGMLLTGIESQDAAWDRYSDHLSRREGKEKIRVKRGHEFQLIAKLIDDGILPFIAQPVDKEDLRKPLVDFTLRDYQEEARQRFLKTGAVGIYWSFSAGKTYSGMYAAAEIKGPKLVVVPTTTLVEQWRKRFQEHTQISNEVEVVTYHSYHKIQDKEYSLVLFDEVHHLPANTFAKFSTIRSKYRMGLSGSPIREDNRTDYIFALTGFPIGLSWDSLIELGVIEKPDIRLYIFKHWRDKEKKLQELLAVSKKTIVFCDGISMGKRLAKQHELPFVYGDTKDRLEIIKNSETTIVSRVGDEGLSLPDIERVIEFEFFLGSRRQEVQRMGRVLHGKSKGIHIILMTESEYEKYNKRLYSLYEKGFKIEMVR